jgi:hypothetical protein
LCLPLPGSEGRQAEADPLSRTEAFVAVLK